MNSKDSKKVRLQQILLNMRQDQRQDSFLRELNAKMPMTRAGPAPVHKLGHFGLCVTDFAKAYSFYTTRFNFAPSDVSSKFHSSALLLGSVDI